MDKYMDKYFPKLHKHALSTGVTYSTSLEVEASSAQFDVLLLMFSYSLLPSRTVNTAAAAEDRSGSVAETRWPPSGELVNDSVSNLVLLCHRIT